MKGPRTPVLLRTLRATPGLWRVATTLRRHGILRALQPGRPPPSPESVRGAIEELGPVFTKLGQVLALRRDLLPPNYVQELEHLQDRTPPVAVGEIRALISAELGASPEALFQDFDPEPLAAATIAQVHRARTLSGHRVVVKVRRPGIEELAQRDLMVLHSLADLALAAAPGLKGFDPAGIVRELERSLRLELDFRAEAANMRMFREALADLGWLWIPEVVEERSTRGVLTMEESLGVRVDRFAAEHPEEKERIAREVAALLVHQVFSKGIFHADPHPGNLFVLHDGRLCLHDFGMVGRLRDSTRTALHQLLTATIQRDVRGAADAYVGMGIAEEGLSRFDLEKELGQLIDDIHGRPSEEVSVGQALESLLRIGSSHGLKNPGELLLLTRAFLITEGVLRAVDPEVDAIGLFRAEIGGVEARRMGPEELARRLWEIAVGLERFLGESPGDARRVLRRFADGTLGRLQAPDLEARTTRIARAVERLTGGVVAASFVVGGALLAGLPGWGLPLGVGLLLVGTGLGLLIGIDALGKGRED